MADTPLALFEGIGVEIEYMIVDGDTLNVRPIADELIEAECGSRESEIERGDIAWSNELTLHVIELKTNGPASALPPLPTLFHHNVQRINALLSPMGARLMPTGAHPWMDPATETELWPHEYGPVYQAFDRIFGCSGHGWANLQSTHVNLPFADDREFATLHAAIRLVLPIIPALAASTPIMDGAATGFLDGRMEVYRHNARRVPLVVGHVIPEPVTGRDDYGRVILDPIYAALASHDPDGILRHEWVNARGAIARFDRGAIEIRVIDTQECPQADLAVVAAIHAAVRSLVEGTLGDPEAPIPTTETLAAIFIECIAHADRAVIRDRGFLQCLGVPTATSLTATELWHHLLTMLSRTDPSLHPDRGALAVIMRDGCLARRILKRVAGDYRRDHLRLVYADLCHHLERGTSLVTAP